MAGNLTRESTYAAWQTFCVWIVSTHTPSVYTRPARLDTELEVMFPSELDSPAVIVSAFEATNPALRRSIAQSPLTG